MKAWPPTLPRSWELTQLCCGRSCGRPQPVVLRLTSAGKKTELRERVKIEPGASESVRFDVPPIAAGLWQGVVEVETEDDLPLDNQRPADFVFSRHVERKLAEIRVDKVSDTTTQANAFSVGYGPSERVVFWDTLLDGRFSDREVRFVAAHELAHLARDHIPKSIAWFALFVVPILGAAAFVTERRGGLRNPGTVPLALLVITVAQLVALPLQNAITRRYEAEADWVGLSATRDAQGARTLFRSFARTSLSDPSPPLWAYILFYDHPSELARIEQAEAFRRLPR